MAAAFAWGVISASSLVLGGGIALCFRLSLRAIGLVMAFGAGVLISAVAFNLVEEAFAKGAGHTPVVLGMFAGCLVFFGGDLLIDRAGGGRRKSARGSGDSPLAIVLGTVLDGIPESLVVGLTIFESGKVGAAYLVAVFISDIAESLSSSVGLIASGWRASRILLLWTMIAVVAGVSSLAGYSLFDGVSTNVVGFVLAFAGGAILTMLADTMMPEAFEHGGKLAGVVTTLGFVVALLIDQLA